MARHRNTFNALLIFALAAGFGATLAFLKPASKPAPVPVMAPAVLPATPATTADANTSTAAAMAQFVKRAPDRTVKQREATPVFTEGANGAYTAQTSRYVAKLSAEEGLNFAPQSKEGKRGALSVRLTSVTRGENSIFDRAEDAADDEPAIARGGMLSFMHSPSFTEIYEPRIDGIEQTFVLDSPPGGAGDLKFECAVKLDGLTALPPREGRAGGISFADASGNVAAHYGQVMVRDASKRGLVVEPSFNAATQTIAFAVPEVWVENAKYPLVVDPLVGDEFIIAQANNGNFVEQPAVCAGNGNYLIVWDDYSSGAPALKGAIATTGGVTSAFFLTGLAGAPLPYRFQRVEIAFDGTFWLVVWSDDNLSAGGIHGALVTPQGSLFGGSDFLIAGTTGNVLEDPLVTYNGTDFVIAWSDSPVLGGSGVQIYFMAINYTSNNLITTVAVQAIPAPAFPVFQRLEYLTAQRPAGDCLLLYQDVTESPPIHRSVRIQTTGVLRDPGGTALFFEDVVLDDGTPGYGSPIGAVFTNNEWQILSSYNQLQDSAVFMHRLSPAGVVTPPTGIFTTMGLGPTGLTRSGFDETQAPVFPGATEWLFLRTEKVNNNLFHIIGKRVDFDGTDHDAIPFQVDLSTIRGITRNAVAAQSGTQFLVAWLDGNLALSQPGDRASINAAFVDATAPNPEQSPALVAVAAASPTSGDPGIEVGFDATGSKGTHLTTRWDFGDGTAPVTQLDQPHHIYKAAGTYIARLTLSNGAYTVFDTVVITVGMGGPIQVGIPVINTPPIVSGLLVTNAIISLDFFNGNNNKATIAGIFDVSALPTSLIGANATVTIGSTPFTFPLDAKGQHKTDVGINPAMAFAINTTTGVFTFQLANASTTLRADMVSRGMVGAKLPANPKTFVSIPIALKIANSKITLNSTADVSTQYTTSGYGSAGQSTVHSAGLGTYKFNGTGAEVSGSFLVTSFSATEGTLKHSYTIKGVLVKPGTYKPSLTGAFNVYVGSYHASLPGGLILNKSGTLTYMQKKLTSGIKKLTINMNTGAFLLQMVAIPADDLSGGTGLPLAKSGAGISKVDLNLSFNFDLLNNETMSAGRLMYIQRANSNSKSWKLR